MLEKFYQAYVLQHPRSVFVLVTLTIIFFAFFATRLQIDASSETLLLQGDKDLKLTREINNRYQTPSFHIVTYSPHNGELLADETLQQIRELKKDLLQLDLIESVTTILDVPLLESPPRPINEVINDIPTLESPDIDKNLAKKELTTSPIYSNNLVSPDFKTTALLANLRVDDQWQEFVRKRNVLRNKEADGSLTPADRVNLQRLEEEFKKHREQVRDTEHRNIVQVRDILEKYRDQADIFLGGVSMIADDMVTFVKNDLKYFGAGVLVFLVVMLWIIFRQLRWLILPVLTCLFSVIVTSGFLGIFGWEVTVISSNFISIQLIITMAVTIHLIVRYRELALEQPEEDQKQLVLQAVMSMATPCFYAILTTMAGFSSLVLSDILPVINFGWMMTIGVAVSLVLTFLIFPSVMMLMPKVDPDTSFETRFMLTRHLAQFTERHGRKIILVSFIVGLFCIVGAARLQVENSFISYFKESTEIFQGMKVIDQKLGGTTPLDIVLNFDSDAGTPDEQAPAESENDEFAEFDAFEDEFEAAKDQAQYWFTAKRMAEVERVHDYLDSIPETGKVLSLATMLKVGRKLNDGKPLDNFMLALIYNELPEKFRKIILSPYVSVEDDQVRFAVRVRDSQPDLRRHELIQRIRTGLENELDLEPDRFALGSLLILYDNLLQSLFDSQIKTLGAVMLALMGMFLLLFRSIKIALIAITPNLLSVAVVLGFMGWVKMPLDLMTITIAAISVGIAVDDTIHYIHRFRKEFSQTGRYLESMHRAHSSIGFAMYYTSATIIIGFSILILSSFIPTIYFGLLTGLAMLIALVAALTLLPQLIILFKPFGPEK
ncbi:MAG: hypothetical protein C0623_11515 [Desulfuromonas sp.]|nr:MAG: hypothetical protein C0623_11515 [Desulfuromonas sp.]